MYKLTQCLQVILETFAGLWLPLAQKYFHGELLLPLSVIQLVWMHRFCGELWLLRMNLTSTLQAPVFHHVFVMIMWPKTTPPIKNNMVVISNGTTTMLCGIELQSFWSIFQNTECIPQCVQYLSFVTHSYWSPHESRDSSSYTVLKSLAHRYN